MINLLNGDCYKLIKEIPDKSIDLIYTDVPYLYKNHGDTTKSRVAKNIAEKNKAISKMSDGIDYAILDEFIRVCKFPYVYIWCSKLQILDIMNYFSKYNLVYEILVWCKTNPIPATNNVWLNDVEYCLLFREPGTTKLNDGMELKSKYYISPINVKDKALYNHPTIKPLELVTRHILHSTNDNSVVLDCFMGSGTTGVACVNTKRNFIGMEIDKNYFESAKLRIEEAQEKQKMKLF